MMIKPKFWDYKYLNLPALILLPFTIVIRLSNFFFRFYPKINNKKIISICVGNIYLGGTGKTPTTIKLFNILKKIRKNVVTGKKTNSSHIDEILILKKKTSLLLAKSRNQIITKAVKKKIDIIVFDDGLQDKYIDYNIKFACFDSVSGVGNASLIPSGPLRENLSSIKRFDGIFLKYINKKNQRLINLIKKQSPKINIFHTKYRIKNKKIFDLKKKYLVFSGIGNSIALQKFLMYENFKIIKSLEYPDHHNYDLGDLKKIFKIAHEYRASIITTEKDYIKIPKVYKKIISFIEIDLFIENEDKLIKFLKSKINEKH